MTKDMLLFEELEGVEEFSTAEDAGYVTGVIAIVGTAIYVGIAVT